MSLAINKKKKKLGFFIVSVSWFLLVLSQTGIAMIALTDEEMSNVSGQALIVSNKIQGTGSTATGTNGLTFYSAGLDAELALNLNIKNLELGRTGTGATDVDIWAENVAFGCTADASGNCVNSSAASQLRDFVLTRPFFQFAIENDESVTNRRVVGIRLGAENVDGPLSIGEFKTFSGFLSATANLTMLGETDVSPTCREPDVCPNTAGRSRYTNASAYLGLNDEEILSALGYRVNYRDVTIDYNTVQRSNLGVQLSGKRLTQAGIAGLELGAVVDEIVADVELNRRCIRNIFNGCSALAGAFADMLMPLLRNGIAEYIKSELARGLGYTGSSNPDVISNWLNAYVLPYNLSNVHQLDVASELFGLSFQSQDLRYPGYEGDVPAGWGMYLPDAFTLNIEDQVSTLVKNIANNSAARDGNIVDLGLPVYDNCWGSATFC